MVYQERCEICSTRGLKSRGAIIAEIRRLPLPSHRALSQHAARALREAILAGRYRPGERLVERDLADELAISRAPVREALWLLAKDGLVTLTPHRGAVVSAVSAELVIDAFAVRVLLEGMAARLATARMGPEEWSRMDRLIEEMDEAGRHQAQGPPGTRDARPLVDQDLEFHRVLTGACLRPVLLEALGAIWNKTYLLISASREAYPSDRLAELHRPILEAARSREPERVEAAVRDHLAFGERTLLEYLRKDSSG